MTKTNKASWLWIIAGILFLATGVRNLFLPGFLSISPTPSYNVAIYAALGVFFLILGGSKYVRTREATTEPREDEGLR